MYSKSEKKALTGGLLLLTAASVITLSPAFSMASQAITDARNNKPDAPLTPEQELGMDGYRLLQHQGYGSIGQGYSVHIMREETTFKDPQNPWAGVTMVFNTTAPGTISPMMVTVECNPTDPVNPGPSQACSIKL